MNFRDAIQEIIKINQVIVDKKLNEILPRTKELQTAYNTEVKPLLTEFRKNYGVSERNLLKGLLQNSDYENFDKLKIQTFGNWGRKINHYIWAAIFLQNDNNSASDSLQFYIVIDNEGIKFGFGYGDRIDSNHTQVINFKDNDRCQEIILRSIEKNNLEVIGLKAGSPEINFSHVVANNVIKKKDDFVHWNNDIHLIRKFSQEFIPDDIERIVQDVINDLLPICNHIGQSTNTSHIRYWLYAPGENAKNWNEFFANGIMALGWDELGDLREYRSRTEIKEALTKSYGGDGSKKNDVSANDDFVNKIKTGDIIIAKKGRSELLGYGVVQSDYKYDNNRSEYHSIRDVDWKLKGNWQLDFSLVIKTLTDITKYESDHPDYDTFHERLMGVMSNNNQSENAQNMRFPLNTIFYGPPGTGKTYHTVIRAAQIITGSKIDSYSEALEIFRSNLHDRIEFITFHQNYSYEDFIQGIRPETGHSSSLVFEKKDGVFKRIADRALEDIKGVPSKTPRNYVIIIDEINRANISRVFGELITLIEPDKRSEGAIPLEAKLPSGDQFMVPSNLFIIGTMNTADKSIALLDIALRRRFEFESMYPKYRIDGQEIHDVEILKRINDKVVNLKGYDFQIGHSYFMGENYDLVQRMNKKVIPLLLEYFMNDENEVREILKSAGLSIIENSWPLKISGKND